MRMIRTLPISVHLVVVVVIAAAVAAIGSSVLAQWLSPWTAATVATVTVGILAGLVIWRSFVPVRALFRALAGTVDAYRDGDFSFGIHWDRHADLTDLVQAHNALGNTLRAQRIDLVQRELLLDTVVQNTPVAMLLLDPSDRVVLSNLAARRLFSRGRKLEGHLLDAVLAEVPSAVREAFERGGDGLFTVAHEHREDIHQISRRLFRLNGRQHELILLRNMTAELRHAEVQAWKKVIRVISHELNKSLAPIASLAHSGRELVRRGQTERLSQVLETIGERARHLDGFLQEYARFARLPAPRPEAVHWRGFIARLQTQIPCGLEGEIPDAVACFDPVQIEQALLNLLKNAHESGSAESAVMLSVQRRPAGWKIVVRDRGDGLTEAALANAVLPFYSTKRKGAGLGLALVREIVEAHGGRIDLANRAGGGVRVSVILPAQARGQGRDEPIPVHGLDDTQTDSEQGRR